MKAKRLLAAFIASAMVLGTMSFPAFAEDETQLDSVNVGEEVSVGEDVSLEEAVKTVADGGTVYLAAGTSYSTYGTTYAQGKSLTFVGATDANGKPNTTWYYGFDGTVNGEGGADYSFEGCENITFENVIMKDKVQNANYRGFVRANNLVFKNCTFNSRLCYLGYESTTFKNCVFEDTGDWSLWCYTGDNYVFDGCKFNTSLKGAINLYREDGGVEKTQNVTIKDCTFTKTGDLIDKCAIQVAEDYTPHNNIYNINVSNVKIDGEYASDDTFGQLLLNKNDKTGETLRVTVDGEMIFPSPAAKIGEKEYITLDEAIAAAKDGETVTLLADISGNGVIVQSGSNLTIDLNHHTYTIDGETVGSSGTETNGFQLLRDSNIKFMNGTITSHKAKILIQNYSNLTLENVTLDGSNLVGSNPYTLSNNFGKTVLTGNTNIIAKAGGVAFDVYNWKPNYDSVSVTLDETMTGTIQGKIEFATTEAESNPETHKLVINGGTFTDKDVRIVLGKDYNNPKTKSIDDFIASGYAKTKNADGNYQVLPVVAKVGDTGYATLADAVAAAQSGDIVKLLNNAAGNGVKVQSDSNLTIDLNNHTYTIDGTTVGSSGTETNGFQLLRDSTIKFKNGTITSDKAKILIQNYSNLTLENVTLDGSRLVGSKPYTLSNNFGKTVLTGNTNIIAQDDGVAFDCYYWPKNGYGDGVHVTIDENFTGKITGKIEKTHDGSTTDETAAEKSSITVKAGTFTTDISEYVAKGYYAKKNNNGTYSVLSKSTIIDTAKTTGAEITLDNLRGNDAIKHEDDATYKVVVSTAPKADVEKANDAIAANTEDSNTDKAIFDISVEKTDSNGTTTVLDGEDGVKNQQVTITLGETPQRDSKVYIYHVDNGSATRVAEVIANGTNKVTFEAPSFSTYAVTYTPVAMVEDNITPNVNVVFSRVEGSRNQYYITLKADTAGKKINRFMSADLAFKNGCPTVDYDIKAATNMDVTLQSVSSDNKSREYHFEMDGISASYATGEGITIGTITFEGYGTLDFSVDTSFDAGHSINIVNTAKINDNIVDNYSINGAEGGGTLLVNGNVVDNLATDESGTIENVTLSPETKRLEINIAGNNAFGNNEVAYQDMTVEISGGDLLATKTINLGSTPTWENIGNANISVDFDASTSTYTIGLDKELTINTSYTVTVKGAGYRTTRYTVRMTADKTLNFWNNVKDAEEVVEVGKADSAVKTNFLAGDIVKDNDINIYDLSAVVSYFGEVSPAMDNAWDYAKYDLNRDGKIDSKDVAYVLVSWGN